MNLRRMITAAVLAPAFFLMLIPARRDSAVMDETAHICAGYSYVRFLDYRLNPEHPPLVKAFCALPLLLRKINFPSHDDSWLNKTNAEWEAGTKFLYESGNDADAIIFEARLMAMLLTLALIGFVYFWAQELLGSRWALLPAALTAFSPNFLAHGHYVTTDAGAALGFLVSVYFFLRFVENPNAGTSLKAGAALGFALLTKFSTAILPPFFILLIGAASLRGGGFWKTFLRYCRGLAAAFACAGLLVYAVYFLFTLNYPVSRQCADAQAILRDYHCGTFSDFIAALSCDKIFGPFGEYLLGVRMALHRAGGGNAAFFLGEVSQSGLRLYFPAVFLMKESLPALFTLFLAAFLAAKRLAGNSAGAAAGYLKTDFAGFALLSFAAVYWACGVRSNLHLGVRHLLPALPFMYLAAAKSLKKNFGAAPAGNWFPNAVAVWLLLNAVSACPYYLSRFNEFFGGNGGGWKYAADSNFDWGQDLKRLSLWIKNPPAGEKVEKIAVDYFGGGNLRYYLGEKAAAWNSAGGSPEKQGIRWLAVSAGKLQEALARPGEGFSRKPEDSYSWLKNPLRPDYVAGTSIFIYKLR